MSFLIIEYAPRLLDNEEFRPVRMDGHYAEQHDAEEIAKKWAEESAHEATRIVVVEICNETKKPKNWK